MTEAGWTRNAPTKEGWYWWKRTENDNPVIVWVNAFHPDKQLRAEMISGRRELLTHFTGLFNGPITPTDRQQGRVEARDKLDELIGEYNGNLDAAWVEWEKWLAQDAKGVGDA